MLPGPVVVCFEFVAALYLLARLQFQFVHPHVLVHVLGLFGHLKLKIVLLFGDEVLLVHQDLDVVILGREHPAQLIDFSAESLQHAVVGVKSPLL